MMFNPTPAELAHREQQVRAFPAILFSVEVAAAFHAISTTDPDSHEAQSASGDVRDGQVEARDHLHVLTPAEVEAHVAYELNDGSRWSVEAAERNPAAGPFRDLVNGPTFERLLLEAVGPQLQPGRLVIALDRAELALITQALDSHGYWQLAEDYQRRDGYVFHEEGNENHDELTAIEALESRLTAVLDALPAPEPDTSGQEDAAADAGRSIFEQRDEMVAAQALKR